MSDPVIGAGNAHKDALARLLAKENIRVTHRDTRTAAFDLTSRTVILPLWDNMSPALYDLLVSHEIGHALFTPPQGWHDALDARGPVFKGYLNIIEDARIERLVKEMYPGLVARYNTAYMEIIKKGFFGVKRRDQVNNLNLIDRINVYCKVGIQSGVTFTAEEFIFVNRAMKTMTWDDVETLANDLFKYIGVKTKFVKAPSKNDMDALRKMLESFKEETADAESDDFVVDDGDDEAVYDSVDDDAPVVVEKPEQKNDFDVKQKEIKEDFVVEESEDDPDDAPAGDDASPVGRAKDGEGKGGESTNNEEFDFDPSDVPAPTTDGALQEGIDSLTEKSPRGTSVTNYTFAKYDPKNHMVPFKKVMALMSTTKDGEVNTYCKNNIKDSPIIGGAYHNYIKPSVDSMAREFEMRKSAGAAARTSKKKTGIIDPVRMNRYKFEDDIFKKMTIVPKGKNHGFIVYLDWSGSMADEIYPALKQTALLAQFCKKINVPFHIYAFSNDGQLAEQTPALPMAYEEGQLAIDAKLRLIEMYNHNMSTADMQRMTGLLMMYYGNYSNKKNAVKMYSESWMPKNVSHSYDWHRNPAFGLTGTPLDSTLLIAPAIHDTFKKGNKLDIVNTIIITDGDSNGLYVANPNGSFDYVNGTWNGHKVYVEIGRKQLIIKKWTTQLIERYRALTNSRTIGYMISQTGPAQCTHYKAKGWFEVDGVDLVGYDSRIFIHPNILSSSSSVGDALGTKKVTVGSLTNAMKKSGESKERHRSLLTRVSKLVA